MKYLPLIFLIISFSHIFSQMSGSYTIGQSGNDFYTISSALVTLKNTGMNGTVEFIINDGIYTTFEVSDLTPPGNDSLIIRSASGIPNQVNFKLSANNNCRVLNSERIFIKNISFSKNSQLQSKGIFYIDSSNNINFNNCKITDNESLNYISGEATIVVKNSQNIQFNSSKVSCLSGLSNTASQSALLTNNSSCYFYNDSIIGGLQIDQQNSLIEFYKSYLKVSFESNNFAIKTIDSCKVDLYATSLANYKCQIDTIKNSIFEGSAELFISNLYTSNSTFDIPIKINPGSFNTKLVNNNFNANFIFNGSINSFNDSLKLYKNSFFSECLLSLSNKTDVINNFFYDTTIINGSFCNLFHNSFGQNANLEFNANGKIINNSLNTLHGSKTLFNENFSNNNYMSNDVITLEKSIFDSSPSFYNPTYSSALDLHINNPALIGRATVLNHSETLVDIDGENRVNNQTIGADELCLDATITDTVYVDCGTEFRLTTCANFDSLGLFWKPGYLMQDSTVTNPTLIINGNTLAWIEDSLGSIVDSVLFIPSAPLIGDSTTFSFTCGIQLNISTLTPPNSSISWSPAGISNTHTSNSIIVGGYTATYIATVDMGVCGVKTDYITLVSDSTPPNAFSSFQIWDNDCLEVEFYVNGACYDSSFCEFEDGFTSNQSYFTHTFLEDGIHSFVFTMWYQGQANTHTGYFNVIGCTDINNSDIVLLSSYPNPVSETLNVTVTNTLIGEDYQVVNMNGVIIYQGVIKSESFQLKTKDYPKGIYLLRAKESAIKIIKQ